jgi:hypothetical protein
MHSVGCVLEMSRGEHVRAGVQPELSTAFPFRIAQRSVVISSDSLSVENGFNF